MTNVAEEKGGDVVAEVNHHDHVSPPNEKSPHAVPQGDAHVTFKVWIVVCIVSIPSAELSEGHL
jgi:hypothetical protein